MSLILGHLSDAVPLYASTERRAAAIVLSLAFVAVVGAYAFVQIRRAVRRRNDDG
jgi:hypothetical protein